MYESKSLECSPAIADLWNACPQAPITGGSLQLFLTLINTLFLAKCNLATEKMYPENIASTLSDNQEFDFIVVGAGSAGSVVANRLSENPDWKVLLLEAGTYPSTSSEIPNIFGSLQLTEEDWQYTMQPSDDYCLGMKGKTCRCPRGKVLGGTSVINAMNYLRGNKLDYDSWTEMVNEDWSYDSVYPYFLKSENVQDPILDNSEKHAKGGYLTTSRAIFDGPLIDVMTNGVKELGYDLHDDEANLGYFHALTTIENGTRCSSSKAFLSKINRKNLYLATDAFVKKVIINTRNKTARGVIVTIDGKDKTIYAKKETILSGGSINSPQLLMLSGVGPSNHLRTLGINVVQDLPVGENLKDHLTVPIMFIHLPKSLYEPKKLEQEVFDYFMSRNGALGSTGISNLIGLINSRNDSEYHDIQLSHIIFDTREQWVSFMKSVNYADEIINSDLRFPALEIWPTLSKPKSMGKIRLSSSDPFSKPLIYPNMFSDEHNEDLETLLRGIKYVMKLVESKPFQEHNLTISKHNIPNCDHLEFKTDDYWRCAMRNMANTMYHPVSTCKMGLVTDKTSVVDSKLQVHGINNLRVVDASIMPDITSVNTNAPTIMIGERGADFIKLVWK